MTVVYVLADGAGRPLYIGFSEDVATRIDAHRRASWWAEVVDVQVYPMTSRDEGLYVERSLIRECGPKRNVGSNTKRPGAALPVTRELVEEFSSTRPAVPDQTSIRAGVGVTPAEYGAHLAAQAGPVSDDTVEVVARIFATMPAPLAVAS